MVKISIYIDGLGPGGAENLLLDMIPKLEDAGLQLQVYCLKGTYPKEARFFDAGVVVDKLSTMRVFWHFLFKKEICYVHLSKCLMLCLVALTIRNLFGQKPQFIWHSHTTLQFFKLPSPKRAHFNKVVLRLLKFVLVRRLLKVIVGTEAQKQELIDLGGKPYASGFADHIKVVVNSFPQTVIRDLQAVQEKRESLGKDSRLKFFTLSRLYDLKQLDWAIDACAAVAKKWPQYHIELKICGRGEELDKLSQHAIQYQSISNLKVIFPGFVKHLSEVSIGSDFYLFPSRLEGFPLSLTEAALTGILCVSNDCPTGPQDLAEYFPNIILASPPSYEVFVSRTVEAVGWALSMKTPHAFTLKRHWPSLEEVMPSIAAFLTTPE